MTAADLQRGRRFDAADRVIRLGIAATLVLTVLKMAAGHFGRSQAVFADGVENACDLAVGVGALLALRVSREPLDVRHPYGHGRAEHITALLIGAAILATGGWILAAAGQAVLFHERIRPTWPAVAAAAVTVGAKELLTRYTLRVGTRLGSPSLRALAQDHRKDAVTSIATLLGAGCASLGVTLLDPLAAGLTALLILRTGWRTCSTAAQELLDAALPEEQTRTLTRLAESVPGVDRVHEIKGRRSGQYTIIDLKLEMDPEMTVRQSHEVATCVKRLIFDACPTVGDVMIHVNPRDDLHHEDLVRL